VNDKTHFATIKRRMVEEVSDHKISSKAREREREREKRKRGERGGKEGEREREIMKSNWRRTLERDNAALSTPLTSCRKTSTICI